MESFIINTKDTDYACLELHSEKKDGKILIEVEESNYMATFFFSLDKTEAIELRNLLTELINKDITNED